MDKKTLPNSTTLTGMGGKSGKGGKKGGVKARRAGSVERAGRTRKRGEWIGGNILFLHPHVPSERGFGEAMQSQRNFAEQSYRKRQTRDRCGFGHHFVPSTPPHRRLGGEYVLLPPISPPSFLLPPSSLPDILLEPLKIRRTDNSREMMMDHLRSPTGRKLFHEFLTSKYCEENLDFILAVIIIFSRTLFSAFFIFSEIFANSEF
jgi:hypothetical protein